ncbi:hypothetical protein FLA_3990 [Filimonas lacunae]|nr:hypothetical protein FLA_3990 [Filimonas lacunae]
MLFFFTCSLQAQVKKTENIVVVTLDGMRWQEVFTGIDSALVANHHFTKDSADVVAAFGAANDTARRKKLFPFLWTEVVAKGQLYGNKKRGGNMQVANPYKFSYPGYNEIFTGYPDTAVNSNDKIANKNHNVLEFINGKKGYTGKVAAFATWDCFPYILNKWRSGIYVNSGLDTIRLQAPALQLINDMQFITARPIDVRLDAYTYFAAREYLKAYKPKVLYVAFDETDDFAHSGMYDQYLKSAHAEDAMLADLWHTLQSTSEYAGKTTMIVLCDHGRGDAVKAEWISHGKEIVGAEDIWMAVIGPDTRALGEITHSGVVYQKQVAATIAALLGFEFKPAGHETGAPVTGMLP